MEPVEWAKQEAERLGRLQGRGNSHELGPTIEFLRRHSGPESTFTQEAQNGLVQGVAGYGRRALQAWVHWIESGGAAALPTPAQSRIDASTDLMEQVQALLDDDKVHEAAAVMLAGAALEEFLRALLAMHPQATVQGRPGISNYAAALQRSGVLGRQDGKELTSLAGIRNAAAHGQFGALSREQAALFADRISLFMQQHRLDACG